MDGPKPIAKRGRGIKEWSTLRAPLSDTGRQKSLRCNLRRIKAKSAASD